MGWSKDVVLMINLVQILAGFLSGVIGGLGLGGGAVLLIYLRVFENTEQLKAQGINLLFFIPIGISAVTVYIIKKQIKWRTVIPLFAFGVVGSILGITLTKYISGEVLNITFAVFLIVLGSMEIIKGFLLKNKKKCGNIKKE